MASIITHKDTQTTIDADGNASTTVKETTSKVERSAEPDYIKLYTRMWCEFNRIPERWRGLFFELVARMSYCNAADLQTSQVVYISGPNGRAIKERLGWKKDNLMKGLKALQDCGAIKRVDRGVYQVNPNYAARGEWKYNPRLSRGGVEDLIATFNFKTGTVNTNIVWADDGENSPLNQTYRKGLGVKPTDNAVLKKIATKAANDANSQPAKYEDIENLIDGESDRCYEVSEHTKAIWSDDGNLIYSNDDFDASAEFDRLTAVDE